MADTSTPTVFPTVSNETQALLAQKRKQIEETRQPDYVGGTLKTGFGIVAGFATGLTTTIAGALTHAVKVIKKNGLSFNRNGAEFAEAEKLGRMNPAEQEKFLEQFGERITKDLATHDGSLSAAIVRNGRLLTYGGAALGGLVGYLLYRNKKERKLKPLEQEAKALESLNVQAQAQEKKLAESAKRQEEAAQELASLKSEQAETAEKLQALEQTSHEKEKRHSERDHSHNRHAKHEERRKEHHQEFAEEPKFTKHHKPRDSFADPEETSASWKEREQNRSESDLGVAV